MSDFASDPVSGDRVLDSLEQEIFRYTAQSITEELEINITRTAYSPLIHEAQDYAITLVSPDFKPYAQSEASIPIFFSDMGEPVRLAVQAIGDDLGPGDVFVINYDSGQHINNTTMAAPLYHGERITGYVAVRVHWADLGGLVPGGQVMTARNIFQEGTRYVGLRLMRRGKLQPEVVATIQANTYQKAVLTGDMMSQLAACVLGAKRWQERVVSRWSADEVQDIVKAQLAASAARARMAIAGLPDGTYEASHPWKFSHSGVDVDITLKLRLIVAGDEMTADLSGMPPQVELPINAGAAGGGMAAVRLAFRYLVGGDFLTDYGFFEPLKIILPEGTIVSAAREAAMGFWNATISLVIDLFLRAIGSKHPELVPASHFASVGGIMVYGHREDGTLWRTADGAVGGLGAEHDRPGYGPVKALYLGNMKSVPVEMIESRFPIRYHVHRLDREAGGGGLHRGGPGVERRFEVLSDAVIDAYPELSHPAPGLAGGEPGKLGEIRVRKPGSAEWELANKGSGADLDAVPAGTQVRQRSGGGGGWGTPRRASGTAAA